MRYDSYLKAPMVNLTGLQYLELNRIEEYKHRRVYYDLPAG